MNLNFGTTVTLVKKFEKRKKLEISKAEAARIDRHRKKLELFSNIVRHWISRLDRLMLRCQED